MNPGIVPAELQGLSQVCLSASLYVHAWHLH
jgi:hypothetical protein